MSPCWQAPGAIRHIAAAEEEEIRLLFEFHLWLRLARLVGLAVTRLSVFAPDRVSETDCRVVLRALLRVYEALHPDFPRAPGL